MGIKTVLHPRYSPDLVLCDFWLFPKLTGCRYETTEQMKEALTKVINTLTQEDFHGAFQKFLERYNKCIAAGEDYFEGDSSFICVLSIKVLIRKKSGNLFNDPWIYSFELISNVFLWAPSQGRVKALCRYGMYSWRPAGSNERYGGVAREGQGYPCWCRDMMMMIYSLKYL